MVRSGRQVGEGGAAVKDRAAPAKQTSHHRHDGMTACLRQRVPPHDKALPGELSGGSANVHTTEVNGGNIDVVKAVIAVGVKGFLSQLAPGARQRGIAAQHKEATLLSEAQRELGLWEYVLGHQGPDDAVPGLPQTHNSIS